VSETLTWKRFWLLVRSDAIADYRFVAIVSAAIAGLMLLSALNAGSNAFSFYETWFTGLLFFGGQVIASFSFRELHDKTRNEAYLLLPASALEKTLARLFRSTVAFVAYLVVFTTIASLVIEGIKWAVLGRANPVFTPFAPAIWQRLDVFIVVQSLFFLGAAWFRRLHFVKTLAALTLAPIALGIIGGTLLRLVLGERPEVAFSGLSERGFYNLYLAHQLAFDSAFVALKVLVFVALPLFCWYVAWLRVKEAQASDGV
jgi:hypothetical protein